MENKVDILAIGAHPDDVELSCSGTLLRHIAMGKKVAIVDLTQGELGTRGSAELRMKEAEASRQLMGAVGRDNLGLADGFFREDRDSLLKLITSIRKYRPEIVLANAVKDRHPDHGRGASFAARACFLSGLGKIITEWESHEQEKWRPKAIYHYIQDHQNKPDLIVDITAHIDKKMDCIKCFGSQFYDPASVEPSSPISGESFLKVIKAKSRVFGRYIDADFGEGFSITRPIGIENLLELI